MLVVKVHENEFVESWKTKPVIAVIEWTECYSVNNSRYVGTRKGE